MARQLSAEFRQSYLEFESYPKNLVQERLYNGVAETYERRLGNPGAKLLMSDDKLTYVVAHDHGYRGKGEEHKVLSFDSRNAEQFQILRGAVLSLISK